MDALGKNGCYNDKCTTALKVQPEEDGIACTKKTQVKEDVGVNGGCEYFKILVKPHARQTWIKMLRNS